MLTFGNFLFLYLQEVDKKRKKKNAYVGVDDEYMIYICDEYEVSKGFLIVFGLLFGQQFLSRYILII